MPDQDIIKILELEDDPSDTELIEFELKKEGIRFDSIRVETENDFRKCILEFEPDIILSDYSLPTFNGRAALKIKNEISPEIPLIIVTGSNNESIAVDCMKEGAADYILKGAISRLPFSVLSSIEQRKTLREKQQAEILIQQSEAKYRSLVEQMHEGLIRVDNNDHILYVNDNFCKMLGFSAEELIGKIGHEIIIPEEDRNTIIEKNKQRLDDISEQYEIRMLKKSGEKIFVLMNASPVKDESGVVVGSMATCIDITAKKITENALIESEEKFRKAFITSPDAINISRMADGSFVLINRGFTQMMGYTEADVKGRTVVDIKIWDNSKDRIKLLEGLVAKGYAENLEACFTTKYGDKKTGLISAVIINLNGVQNVLSIIRDITDRKNLEIAMSFSEKKFRLLYESSPVAYHSLDTEGHIIEVNNAWLMLLGYEKDAIIGKCISEFLRPDYVPIWRERFKAYINSGISRNSEYVYLSSSGQEIFLSIDGSIGYDAKTGNKLTHCVLHNITELKKAQEELIIAREKAEESDRLKSAFLANMSHEIRTPMNGILGFAELLKDPDTDENQKNKYIDIINNSSKQLLGIINDIIDISKIEAGFETFKNERFILNDLFDELYAFFQPLAAQKNVEIILEKGLPDEDSVLESDPVKLKQSMANVIGNALKFTEKGSVSFGYSLQENTITIDVKDTGIGMDQKFLNVIFDRFRQIEASYSRKFRGTGLGLSISKSYIEMMGGSISVASELGKGTCFTIRLPYKKAATAPVKQKEEDAYKLPMIDLSGKTILVAEDEDINQMYLRSALTPTGAELLFASNGLEALDIFKKNPGISLILMDIKMPQMNGTDCTIALKALDKTVPVIAVTAYAFTEDREKCLNSGCDDYIQKPFRIKELYEIIKKHCR